MNVRRRRLARGERNGPRALPLPGGLSLRALAPNAITAAGLASGLTGIRFAITAASGGALAAHPIALTNALPLDDWQKSVLAVILAGVLDGLDGRIARLLNAQSRFGSELDSLSDAVSFGVAPALILFLWSLQMAPRLGWFASLAFAICMALRLARFNARIDMADEPRKAAGYLTGVPAPVGAGLAFLPMLLWIAAREWAPDAMPLLRQPWLVGGWLVLVAFLLISSIATFSWGALRPRRTIRLELIALVALVFAALLSEPWLTLIGICAIYIVLLPVSVLRYARIKRRAARAGNGSGPAAPPA